MLEFPSFVKLHNIPLYVYTTSCLSLHLSVDMWVSSTLLYNWPLIHCDLLLSILRLQWEMEKPYIYMYIEYYFLGHMEVLALLCPWVLNALTFQNQFKGDCWGQPLPCFQGTFASSIRALAQNSLYIFFFITSTAKFKNLAGRIWVICIFSLYITQNMAPSRHSGNFAKWMAHKTSNFG